MPLFLFITAFVVSNVVLCVLCVLCGVAKIENARMQRCIRYRTSRVPGSYPGLRFWKKLMSSTNWAMPSPLAKPKHFVFLRKLRDSAVVDMYGAEEFLEDKFDLARSEARIILREWMKNPEGLV